MFICAFANAKKQNMQLAVVGLLMNLNDKYLSLRSSVLVNVLVMYTCITPKDTIRRLKFEVKRRTERYTEIISSL